MNITPEESPRFFGLDLSQVRRDWQAAGALLLSSRGLRWLVPQVPLKLHRADGGVSGWLMQRDLALPSEQALKGAHAQAIELAPDRVLERHLTLPPLSPGDLARAVQLDVGAASPFAPDQTVFGYAVHPGAGAGGAAKVDVAITSRQQVDEALRAAGEDSAGGGQAQPEVWAGIPASGPQRPSVIRPIVMQGYGEATRQAQVRRGIAQRLAWLLLALALLGALVVTPAALARLRAQQAQQAFDALRGQAAPQLAQREALTENLERQRVLGEMLGRQLAMPPALDMLTRALPDGAWLTSIRVEEAKLVLNGQADDAAALVQRLSGQPGAHDVRLASPATRGAGASKESFIIEMNLDAARYGVAAPKTASKTAPEAAASGAVPATAPESTPKTAEATS
ncbi:PilN domain-containing protein [Ottowia sp.]|uniref:PilN domain-containing protein n=1 Tax=Ottowia sp. TaxID=1898956 RepID=UPI003A8AFE60